MSQFDSLTPTFRKLLREMADKMTPDGAKPAVDKDKGRPCISSIQCFVKVAVKAWLETLDESSRGEVTRVFSEINDLDADEFLRLMRAEGASTPFDLAGGMFSCEPTGNEVEGLVTPK